MTDDVATESDAHDARPGSDAPGPRARKYGQSLGRFVVAVALTSLCLWAYLRAVGGGSFPLAGLLFLGRDGSGRSASPLARALLAMVSTAADPRPLI